MSIYYEFLMDLWRKDVDEFLKQALKVLDQLSPEEKWEVTKLYITSLPENVIAKLLKQKPDKQSSESAIQ
jgi:hypothetical protein